MLVIKTTLHPEKEAAIRKQAENAGLPINAYLTPILNAVGDGRLTVGPIWQESKSSEADSERRTAKSKGAVSRD